MGRGNKTYSTRPQDSEKACKAKGTNLRVHFKNTYETARAIKNKTLFQARAYLQDVIALKQAVPFRVFTGGCGRKSLGKAHKHANVRFPKKSAVFLLDMLKNAEANAEDKNLDPSKLQITHIQVQRAPKQRRRTYRAHGRINAYMASPCHIEMILEEQEESVAKPKGSDGKRKKASKKKAAREAADAMDFD